MAMEINDFIRIKMSKDKLGKKRVCPTTGKKFYDLNKDPAVSPYTGELLNIVNIEDQEKEEIVEAIAETEVDETEVNSAEENIEEIDNVIENDEEESIPEIDEETIPDLENTTDDEVIENEADEEINEFDTEDLDDLEDENDDDFLNDDDVTGVIKTVSSDNDDS